MENLIKLPVAVFACVLFAFTITQIAEIFTFGRIIKKKNLDPFLEKNIENYRKSVFSPPDLFHGFEFGMPFISKLPFSFLNSWYIHEYGTIPKWSKWNKILTEMRKEKMENASGKRLSDLLN